MRIASLLCVPLLAVASGAIAEDFRFHKDLERGVVTVAHESADPRLNLFAEKRMFRMASLRCSSMQLPRIRPEVEVTQTCAGDATDDGCSLWRVEASYQCEESLRWSPDPGMMQARMVPRPTDAAILR